MFGEVVLIENARCRLTRKKVLITGADGFIGSHLTEALVRQGYETRAFVQYNSFNSWGWLDSVPIEVSSEFEVILGDIRDQDSVTSAMKECDAVLHLAALIAIPYSYSAPASYFETNLNGTLNVLRAGRAMGVDRIIHTSTSEVYGTAKFVPITEEHPLQSQSPYSASKTAADQLALSFFHSYECPVAILRPFNVFGPRQSARALIPTVITQIASGFEEIKLGALSPTREFNFVSDTVRAFLSSLVANGIFGEVINVGNGHEISVGEIALLIAELMQKEVRIVSEEKRLRPAGSEVERLCADNGKAQRLLGWTPAYGDLMGLRRGLIETIEWFGTEANLSRYRSNSYTV